MLAHDGLTRPLAGPGCQTRELETVNLRDLLGGKHGTTLGG